MNRVTLIGRLASEPELRTTGNGIATASFRLAVQREYENANGVREADFLPIVLWRHSAVYAQKYLHKGDRAAVDGRIQTRSYDAQDGSKRYVTEIVAERIEGFGNRQAEAGETQPQEEKNNFCEVDESELPF